MLKSTESTVQSSEGAVTTKASSPSFQTSVAGVKRQETGSARFCREEDRAGLSGFLSYF